MIKFFDDRQEVSDVFNNFLLSKYNLMLKPEFLVPKLHIDIQLKYTFKNIDETLLIFWLFFILCGKSPVVTFSKFNKKSCTMLFKDVSVEFIIFLLSDFLYNAKCIQIKKKNFEYISEHKFLCKYSKNSDIHFFCHFAGIFKQNNLEHIFYELGVSGIKLTFKLIFRAKKGSSVKTYFDIIKMLDIEHLLKSYMFEESLK